MVWAHLFSLFIEFKWIMSLEESYEITPSGMRNWNSTLFHLYILRTYLAIQHCTLGSNLLALLGTYLDKQGQESNAWPSPQAMLKRPIWYPRIRNNWYLGNLNNGCKHALRIWKTEKSIHFLICFRKCWKKSYMSDFCESFLYQTLNCTYTLKANMELYFSRPIYWKGGRKF